MAKFCEKTEMPKFGPKNALFGYFWARNLKNYCHMGCTKVWNQSQPPTTIRNHPQLSTTSHNQPQLATTTQKATHNHPQPSKTTKKLPKKAETWDKQLCYCTLKVNTEIDVGFDSDMREWYIHMCVCVCVYILYKSLYLLFFG